MVSLHDKLAQVKRKSESDDQKRQDLVDAVQSIGIETAKKILNGHFDDVSRCVVSMRPSELTVLIVNGLPVTIHLKQCSHNVSKIVVQASNDVKILRGKLFDKICTTELNMTKNGGAQ